MAEKSSLEVSNKHLTRRFVQVELEVLHVLPFDSVRKRMSVLVRDPASGERKLFCKGADSNMLPRLARPQTQVSPSVVVFVCVVCENDASTAMALVATCCRVSRVPKLMSAFFCVCSSREWRDGASSCAGRRSYSGIVFQIYIFASISLPLDSNLLQTRVDLTFPLRISEYRIQTSKFQCCLWIQIRVQHFKWVWIRIQCGSRVLMTKNWKKNTADFFFFLNQILQFTYP